MGQIFFCSFGWISVDFFFVLSGFVLCNSLTIAGATGRKGLFRFLKKRILRLFPILVLALTFRFTLQLGEVIQEILWREGGDINGIDSKMLIRYPISILLLQFLYPFSTTLLFPLWSLCTEFYSNLIQIIVRLTGSIRKYIFGILLGILFIILSGIYLDTSLDWTQYNTWIFGFGRALFGFNIGQLVWHSCHRGLKASNSYLHIYALFGFIISINIWDFAREMFLFSFNFTFGLLVLSFSKFRNPAIDSILFRLLKVLGDTSYPVYLFHSVFLGLFARFFTDYSLANFALFYLMNLIFSFLVLKFLEPKIRVFLSRYIRV